MPRKARKRTKSGIYHIVVQGPDGKKVFGTDEDKARYLEVIRRYRQSGTIRLYAYCILDNSAHLAIEEVTLNVSEVMRGAGISYVHWYNRKYERRGRLFRDRYASEIVPTEGALVRTIRFIHQLPARYGLVRQMGRYRWSSYSEYRDHHSTIDSDLLNGVIGEWNFEQYMGSSWQDRYIAEKNSIYNSRKEKKNGKSEQHRRTVGKTGSGESSASEKAAAGGPSSSD